MLSLNRLYALVVVFLISWFQSTTAHSSPARVLKRVAHPSTRALEILPRHRISANEFNKRHPSLLSNSLRYDDSFRLILSAYNETFHLHMRPNDHLIHPAARINYYTMLPDGREVLSRTKPLLRESVLAYWGEVIAAHHSPVRMLEDTAGVVPKPHPADLGWARLIVHHQGSTENGIPPVFEGAFSVNGVIYHVTTKENYLRNKLSLDPLISHSTEAVDDLLVIWRESDVMTPEEEYLVKEGRPTPGNFSVPQFCGHDRLEYNTLSQNLMLIRPASPRLSRLLYPRSLNEPIYRRDDSLPTNSGIGSNFIDSIGSSAGCPTTQKVVYMGVAADCTYVATYGGQENATTQILTNWNAASSLYKSTFNVSLGIAELQVRDETCPTTTDPKFPWNVPCTSAQLQARLSLFSQWRGTRSNDSLGLWHLMSGCPTGSEVGIAWLATLCQQESSGSPGSVVSGTGVSTAGRTEWQVVAHEIGHNFGAIHDCAAGCNSTAPCCPLTSTTCDANAQFVMSPVSQSGETVFSKCTLGNICSVMQGVEGGSVNTSCLVDPDQGRAVISLQMCGNGIVEAGEDCDPGMGTTSNCCDTATCKFKNNALCDPQSSPCCNNQCTFAPSTQICRPSKDPKCDTAEFCTGNSSSCPADVTAKNGQSCGSNDLACASGQCTSIALQCQTVGASMGFQAACPDRSDQSCQISCQDPTSSQSCIRLTSLLIDGSPCGFGGTCLSGKCQSAGIWNTAKAWYRTNLQIAIPVTVVAGLGVLLLLWGIIRGVRRCCGGGKHPSTHDQTMHVAASHARLTSHVRSDHGMNNRQRTVPGYKTDYIQPSVAHNDFKSGRKQEFKYNHSAHGQLEDSTHI